ncbi:alpha/beta hydrolase family esterase [Sphingomonas profundi]|uniref:extracellular catalytic domain type 1 short-chain-length polyhydroxyalkanoate depolymerase n=1 Tax=Alterirhizorhabdus profundi TaxID=2681549 RepID=UPI0012E8964C|nr:PHB depolymerase family esterase [Sphingomonas profundi]
MKLFPALMRAGRLSRKGRPLSALLAIQEAVMAPLTAKPKRKAPARARVAAPRVKAPRASSSAAVKRMPPGSFVDGVHACPQGRLAYKLYTPVGAGRRSLPLVVMLHGCTQNAADFAAGTAMNALADEQGFLVLYPEQSGSANAGRCWNWHLPANQERGGGEPAVIAATTRRIMRTAGADPARVYIAGLSAGGAAAAIVGAAYPDLYCAVGVHSGLARGNVSTFSGAVEAMRKGSGERIGAVKRAARALPLIVFHGDQDRVVYPCNAGGFLSELRRASPQALRERTDRGIAPGGRGYTRTVYRGADGQVALEGWIVHGSGHGWSGGRAAGSYTDPAGPDASREMVRFFLARRKAA